MPITVSVVATFLISSDLSPYPEAFATIQGMVSTAMIFPQVFAPALGTSTFALAIEHRDILGGNLFWIGTFIFGASYLSTTRFSALLTNPRYTRVSTFSDLAGLLA
jgi:hypothetical protein